jgi:predicted Zn-dependent protease
VQSQLAYSRDFEREADRVGFDTLSKAGFDVTAMPTFFEKLQRAGRIYDSNAPVYVRSHPLTTERIADVRNRAQGVRYRQHLDPLAFHLVRAKLRATADNSVDGAREAQKAFATQIAERTYASEAAARYGHAQALLASRDVKGAQAALAALPRGTEHPMIESLGARIRLAAGDAPGAIRLLQAAVKRYPREAYLQVALAEVLQVDGRHADALDLIGEQLRGRRGDPRLYEMQARSFAALGRAMSQHQALGEYYAALGSSMAALEQFQIARCAGGGDFYQQSILDARIRELGERILDERAASGQGDKGGGGGGSRAPGGPGGPGAGPRGVPQRC